MKKRQKDLIKKIENTINYRNARAQKLLKTESFVQHINILYSCFGAFLSVWSLLTKYKSISFVATIVSIILVLSITYLNSQRYVARAKDLYANILDLKNLNTELLKDLSKKDLIEKEKVYNSCLAASEEESDFDKLYCDIFKYLPNRNNPSIKQFKLFQFYTMLISSFLFKTIIILLPFVMTAILIYFVLVDKISILESLFY